MEYKEFIEKTIFRLEQPLFKKVKNILVGEYLSFFFFEEKNLTPIILSEKLCDYFEKLELKTGKSFEKHMEAFMSNLDVIVEKRVAKTPQPRRGKTSPVIVPRARKYYEKAARIKEARKISLRQLTDYVRLMGCLYMSSVVRQNKVVEEVDMSVSVLDIDKMIQNMKTEPGSRGLGRKLLFNTTELYCSDTCTFILLIILLAVAISEKVEGDYYNG